MNHLGFLQEALKEARKAFLKDEVPVGAVLVKGGKIIARAHNLKEARQNPLGHSELLVILKAAKKLQSWRLNECTLYVTLEPCPMCTAALSQARIGNVFFGTLDKKGGALSLGISLHDNARLNHRFAMEHLPLPECAHILTEFFKIRRKTANR